MSSIVIAGDTSGSVTLQAPAVSGSTVLNLPATSGTVQTSGAGYTTNGVAFASSTSVLATGSALTFDGSLLSTTVADNTVGVKFKAATSNIRFLPQDGGAAKIAALNAAESAFYPLITQGSSLQYVIDTSEIARFTSTGLGIGTSSPATKLAVAGGIAGTAGLNISGSGWGVLPYVANSLVIDNNGGETRLFATGANATTDGSFLFYTSQTDGGANERARIDTSGNLLVGTTNTNPGGSDINGISLRPGNFSVISALGATPLGINRGTDDGTLINFSQAGSTEGSISVSGTTVSYNGGHLSRWAQTTTAKDESLVKGTVLSNLDEMNVYTKDGQPVANEQLNKVKVSDTEGDANVAGVFVNWSHDEEHNVDEINMAMTGDMIIRIAQGVTVVRGDLLMSAGDGTAKPQGDDIIRSKTVAKVTSNYITCTYADGSYCVPCVLMAC